MTEADRMCREASALLAALRVGDKQRLAHARVDLEVAVTEYTRAQLRAEGKSGKA
jgi:hypothetical protein